MAAGINIIGPDSVDRPLVGINVIDPNKTDRLIKEIRVIGPDSVDRVVWSSGAGYGVVTTPAAVSWAGAGGPGTTNSTTASASGGTGPYTYSWTLLTYDNVVAPTITAPTSATTTFTQTNIGYGGSWTATFQVTAKDSLNATTTATVAASWNDTRGGGLR